VQLRDNMFNMMGEFSLLLAEQAIFAATAGTPADELPRRGIHYYLLLNMAS